MIHKFLAEHPVSRVRFLSAAFAVPDLAFAPRDACYHALPHCWRYARSSRSGLPGAKHVKVVAGLGVVGNQRQYLAEHALGRPQVRALLQEHVTEGLPRPDRSRFPGYGFL